MRILVNPGVLAAVGGVELNTLQVTRELQARGHVITALYKESGDLLPDWHSMTEQLVQVPGFDAVAATLVSDVPRLLPAVRAARRMKPDVIYLNRCEQLIWGVLAARWSGAKLVVHLHNRPTFPGVSVFGRLAAAFLAVSADISREWITAGVPADRIDVVHNGIDPADYPATGLVERAAARAALGLDPAAYVVLYYGRAAPEKGVDVLLEAWRKLDGAAATLVVVADGEAGGSDYASSLRRDLPDTVTWLPMRRDVSQVLDAADVVVLPAQWQEPFGRVVIEGMATGRPVVASRVGGIPEILTAEFDEFLVEPGDAGELAEKLAFLRDWRSRDPDLGRRCTQHVLDCFSLQRSVDQVEQALHRAVTGRRDGRRRLRQRARAAQDGLSAMVSAMATGRTNKLTKKPTEKPTNKTTTVATSKVRTVHG